MTTKSLFSFAFLFAISFFTVNAQSFDYDQLGKWHNEALSAVMKADPSLTDEQKFDIVVDYTEKATQQTLNITLAEVNSQISPYQDLAPKDLFNQLLVEGKINSKQLVWVEKINAIGEKQNLATFWKELSALEVEIKNNLNETDEIAVLAFAATCRHSGKFWADFGAANGSSDQIKCNCGSSSPRSCCNSCLRSNWWRLALADGIPALIGVAVCLGATPATGPGAVVCWGLAVAATVTSSQQTVARRCPCCSR